jgi:nitrate/nitrite transporter NarK
MSFTTSAFWLSLYMQNHLSFTPLTVAIHLLPQAFFGILVNVIAGLILHRVDGKILVGIGALGYLISALLLANMTVGNEYWGFIFPSLFFSVIGADLQFNVANVSLVL